MGNDISLLINENLTKILIYTTKSIFGIKSHLMNIRYTSNFPFIIPLHAYFSKKIKSYMSTNILEIITEHWRNFRTEYMLKTKNLRFTQIGYKFKRIEIKQ